MLHFYTFFVTGGVYNNGYYATYWLGYDNRMVIWYYPAIFIFFLYDMVTTGKITGVTVVMYSICLLTLVISWSAGAMVSFALILGFYLFSSAKTRNGKNEKLGNFKR